MKNLNIQISETHLAIEKLIENKLGFQFFDKIDGKSITVDNNKMLHFANCCYLGLETNPKLIDGAIKAIKDFGTHTSSARSMLCSSLYKQIEKYLDEIFKGYSVVFPTTTLTSNSVLPLLINETDAIILDAYVHNSVRLATQLCKAKGTFVIMSKHNDMENVGYLVKRLKKEGYRNVWYCADGIYSMHGDGCDIKNLHKLLDDNENFYAYVDDAHGVSWTGKNGSGYVVGNFGLHSKMVLAGSMAKSFAASGGFVIVSDKTIRDYILLNSPNIIFSGTIAPASLGALVESLKIHLSPEIEILQSNLLDLINYFKIKCIELSIPIYSDSKTPIHLIRIGNYEKLVKIQKSLNNMGFFSTTVIYPVIAKGEESMRISLTNHITKADIDDLLINLKILMVKEGVELRKQEEVVR